MTKKRKYAANSTEEEAEEAPLKKQKMIDDGNGDADIGNEDNNSSSIDDYSSELEEGMNLPSGSEEELLI
jgi:hypothetical protein